MDRISDHFSRSEFRCKCGECNYDAVDSELLSVLEELHSYLSKRFEKRIFIEITSGNRCFVHNVRVKGSLNSQHIISKAADIKCWIVLHQDQIDPEIVADFLELRYPDWYGIGRYDDFTHIDVRPKKARWDERTRRESDAG